MRSLMYCHQSDGFCHRCAGTLFKEIGQDVIGILALELTSVFTLSALKGMHGKKLNTMTITKLSDFII